jgi:hypothetical protein
VPSTTSYANNEAPSMPRRVDTSVDARVMIVRRRSNCLAAVCHPVNMRAQRTAMANPRIGCPAQGEEIEYRQPSASATRVRIDSITCASYATPRVLGTVQKQPIGFGDCLIPCSAAGSLWRDFEDSRRPQDDTIVQYSDSRISETFSQRLAHWDHPKVMHAAITTVTEASLTGGERRGRARYHGCASHGGHIHQTVPRQHF